VNEDAKDAKSANDAKDAFTAETNTHTKIQTNKLKDYVLLQFVSVC